MNTDYLQGLRDKLQRRVQRQESVSWQTYIGVLRQFWSFIDREPLLRAITQELQETFPDAKLSAEQIFAGNLQFCDDELAWAAVCHEVLRRFAKEEDPRMVNKLVPQRTSTSYSDYLQGFGTMYLIPFCEYVSERLDDARFLLGQLLRFKHLCEWFWRETLYDAWSRSPNRGEKILAVRLYEFLFKQGIHIHIEPSSVSGEADMVSSQVGPERLIADAKVFNPEKGKGTQYLIQGFRQIYQYTADYNESLGYLIIFNTCNKHLRLSVSGSADPLPRIILNHKTILFLVIDIYPHETTASKRPQGDILEITEAQIVGCITDFGSPSVAAATGTIPT